MAFGEKCKTTSSLTTEKPATQEVTSFPWEKGGSSTPPKANLSVTGPQTIPSQTLSAAHSIPTSSQPVFQPMFTSLPVPPQPTVNLDSASWNREQVTSDSILYMQKNSYLKFR